MSGEGEAVGVSKSAAWGKFTRNVWNTGHRWIDTYHVITIVHVFNREDKRGANDNIHTVSGQECLFENGSKILCICNKEKQCQEWMPWCPHPVCLCKMKQNYVRCLVSKLCIDISGLIVFDIILQGPGTIIVSTF